MSQISQNPTAGPTGQGSERRQQSNSASDSKVFRQGKQRLDADALKENIDIVDYIGRHVSLKKVGREFESCCPFHDDSTPSFKVDQAKQLWNCLAGCGGGDLWAFIMKAEGLEFKDAVPFLANKSGTTFRPPPPPVTEKAAVWTPILSIPDDAPPPPGHHYKLGVPSDRWLYQYAAGHPMFYISRFDKAEGGKEFLPLTYCRNRKTGETSWRWQGAPAPRPLFHLDQLTTDLDALVVVTEGERKCDAATNLLPGTVGTTSANGGGAAGKTDWTPLAGRHVILWLDNDQTGRAYGDEVINLLQKVGVASIRVIRTEFFLTLPDGTTRSALPTKWDAFDAQLEGFTAEHGRVLMANPGNFHAQSMKPEQAAQAAPIQDDDQQPDIPTNWDGSDTTGCPNEQADHPPIYTRKELADMIEATDDFDELTGPIAQQIAESGLPATNILSLRKFIAKKAKVSVASLEKDAQGFQTVQADKDKDHIKAASETVSFMGGNNNLLHALQAIWHWRGDGVWQKLDDREVKQGIHQVVTGDELTKSVVDSILDLVKTEVHRPGLRFEQGGEAVNCLNGELHWLGEQWVLRPHNRENLRITQIPIKYNPGATAPRFEQFLVEIFAGDTDANEKAILVCELLGYTLLATCRFEKFVLLIGPGANGKSVLLSVAEALVGRDSVAAVQPTQFENRFQRAHLHAKLANIVTEIAEGGEINDAQLKSIVSGELTTAEHKHKPPFDFHPVCTCWFGTNHLPHTRDFSDALFRRAIILPFNQKFEGKRCDPLLKEKLIAELPGILNLALEGVAGVLQRGVFTTPPSSEILKRAWRTEVDQAAQFVEEVCTLTPTARTASMAVWRAYQSWSADAGIKRPLNRNNFTTRLKRLGIDDDRGTGGVRMLCGIAIQGVWE